MSSRKRNVSDHSFPSPPTKKPRLELMYTRTDPITGRRGRIRKKNDEYWSSFTRRAKRRKELREKRKGKQPHVIQHEKQQRKQQRTMKRSKRMQQNNTTNNSKTNKDYESRSKQHVNYLELDDYMINLDKKSLEKLSTAQLMQRLKSHNLSTDGLKHELIERWRTYKLSNKD